MVGSRLSCFFKILRKPVKFKFTNYGAGKQRGEEAAPEEKTGSSKQNVGGGGGGGKQRLKTYIKTGRGGCTDKYFEFK